VARTEGAAGEKLRDDGRTDGAVAFAHQVFRRIPASVLEDPCADELDGRGRVLLHAIVTLFLDAGENAAEAGAGRIDQHDVGDVERTFCVVRELERRRRLGLDVVAEIDPARAGREIPCAAIATRSPGRR
jgi:hypothetical protein